MARGIGGAGLTALRAALGAVGGGLEGYTQMRALEQKRQQEQEALNYQRQRDLLLDARQREQAAAQLRREELDAIRTPGMMSAEQFAGMTMPGATPMQPALRQKIGEREYVYSPFVAAAEKHRADVTKERGERQKQQAESKALGQLYEGVSVGGRQLVPTGQGQTLAGLPINAQSSVVGALARIAEAQAKPTRAGGGSIGSALDTGERALLSQAETNARNSTEAFQQTLRGRPKQKDFVNQLTRKPDTAAFAEATRQWAAGDSTFAAQRMADAQAELQRVKADLGVGATAPAGAGDTRGGGASPTASQEARLSQQAQRKIAEIMASGHSPEEKQTMVQQVNAEMTRLLQQMRGGR